ncbi:VOC family protein [Herbiconiux liangxiaofengii]|uniref:VOC family protein n=1 Tax=Herbiconiux liangxiaofengii TaxID=3342795 RepID=UPI0035BB7256
MRLSSAVMFVSDLDRSVAFYEDLLQLEVTVRDSTAALLVGADHYQLYLRSMGKRATHALGSIGVQYLIWSADDPDDLLRCEDVLRRQSPHVTKQHVDGFDIVEGPGPDRVPIMIVYPGPEQLPRDQIIPRLYSW